MALYLGNDLAKQLYINGKPVQIEPLTTITNNDKLSSSDDYILKDSNNNYITVKKEDE